MLDKIREFCGAIYSAIRNKVKSSYAPMVEEPFADNTTSKCMVPGCDGMIKYEKKIPSKEELWDKYYMGAPEQQRQFVEQYKIVKRA